MANQRDVTHFNRVVSTMTRGALCVVLLTSWLHVLPVTCTAFGPADVRQTVSLHVIAHLSFQRGYQRTLESTLSRAQYSRTMEYAWVFQHFNPQVKVVRLPYDNPGDILQRLCEDIFLETSTAVLHIINPFEHFRSQSAQYVSSLVRHVGLPLITWGPEYAASSSKTQDEIRQVQISPTLHHQAQAMLSLLEQFNWGQFSVVYTAHPGHMDFLNAIRMLLHEREKKLEQNNSPKKKIKFRQLSEVEIKHADDVQQVSQELSVLLNTDTRIILLFSHEHETRTILEAAGRQGLLGREFAWLAAFEAIPKAAGNRASHLPVGLLGVEYSSNEKEMQSAVTTAARIWLRALNATAFDAMTGSRPWHAPELQCDSDRDLYWRDGRRFFQYLYNATQQLSKNDNPLYEPEISIVNIQPDEDRGDNRWVKVGSWSPSGLTMNRISWFEDAPGPPSGKPRRYHLRVVTRPEEPYVIYRNATGRNGTCEPSTIPCRVYPRDHDDRKISNKTIIKCCTGLSIDLLLKMNQSLNFDVDLYEVEDFQWGNMIPERT
ncbi:glutamate receptor ionotropic, NMDA 2B-like [Babylonia areolata]|uniref:glutamate receptor ionotropic, NMDA 2B-like n=1 Tax=Babylonia areolata TaxID=304850 RepID=UPI003FD3EA64